MRSAVDPRESRTLGVLEREVAAVHREHAGPLFRYAAGLAPGSAAQDATQEAFLRYFLARSRGLRIENPGAWLRRVARNRLADAARSAAARGEVTASALPDLRAPGCDPEVCCSHSEFLLRAGAALAPRERQCVRLRVEGLSYRQIGALLGIRTGTVGALLARAYRKLRQLDGGRAARHPRAHT